MKILLLIFCLIALRVNAQITDPRYSQITWSVSKVINLDKLEDQFQFNCKFITEGDQPIKWVQTGAAGTTEFTVTSIEGEWGDVSLPGTVTFHVSLDGTVGSIIIIKESGKTYLTMDIGEGARYKFEISNYQ
jgi:hypothetical protein